MKETTRTMTVELTFIEKYEEGDEPVTLDKKAYESWLKSVLQPDHIKVKDLREFIRDED